MFYSQDENPLATKTTVKKMAVNPLTSRVIWKCCVQCCKGWPHEIDTIARNVACNIASCGRAFMLAWVGCQCMDLYRVYLHVRAYLCVYICTCITFCTCVCVRARMCVYVCMYVCMYYVCLYVRVCV